MATKKPVKKAAPARSPAKKVVKKVAPKPAAKKLAQARSTARRPGANNAKRAVAKKVVPAARAAKKSTPTKSNTARKAQRTKANAGGQGTSKPLRTKAGAKKSTHAGRSAAQGKAGQGKAGQGKAVAQKRPPARKVASKPAAAQKVSSKHLKPAKPPKPPKPVLVPKAAPVRLLEPLTPLKRRSGASVSASTVERLRLVLEDEKSRLLRQADELAAEAESLASDRELGDTQFDEESGEGDTISIERERDLALSAAARQTVEEIEHALARMVGGGYGYCQMCGDRIPVARLEAIPWTDLCVKCKSRGERRR